MVNWIKHRVVMLAHPDMIPPTSKCFLSSQVKGSRIEMQPFLIKLLDEAFPSRIKNKVIAPASMGQRSGRAWNENFKKLVNLIISASFFQTNTIRTRSSSGHVRPTWP